MTDVVKKDSVSGLILRGVVTLIAIILYGWINFLINPVATIMSGQIATKQFENSDLSYIVSYAGMNFFEHLGAPIIALFVVLIALWWGPAKRFFAETDKKFMLLLFTVSFVCLSTNSFAYYDKTDFAEAYFILPNESAFFIPDVGANKDSQAQFGSEE